jgi:hypothetical protein
MDNHLENELVPWVDSKWLVLTSAFLLPSVYNSYSCKYYYISNIILLTSMCSMNYWRKATNGWRRKIDFFVSKMMLTSMFFYVLQYMNHNSYGLLCYPNAALCIYFYCKANKLYLCNNKRWIYYHAGFHFLGSINIYVSLCYFSKL